MHLYVFYSRKCEHCASLFKLLPNVKQDVKVETVCLDSTPLSSIPFRLQSVPTIVVNKDSSQTYKGEQAFHVVKGLLGSAAVGASANAGSSGGGDDSLAAYELGQAREMRFSEIAGPAAGLSSTVPRFVEFNHQGSGSDPMTASAPDSVKGGGDSGDQMVKRLIEQRKREL